MFHGYTSLLLVVTTTTTTTTTTAIIIIIITQVSGVRLSNPERTNLLPHYCAHPNYGERLSGNIFHMEAGIHLLLL